MPVVRNTQFNFKEGFCWSDINTTFLKCRIKGKSINDVKSMSLYGLTQEVPEYYFVTLINSSLFSYYVDSFVNNTQTFQINDARQLPIIYPSQNQLHDVKILFDKALYCKFDFFKNKINKTEMEQKMLEIQSQVDTLIYKLYNL